MKHVWEAAKRASIILGGALIMATVVYYMVRFAFDVISYTF